MWGILLPNNILAHFGIDIETGKLGWCSTWHGPTELYRGDYPPDGKTLADWLAAHPGFVNALTPL
jgi:hypothetical protein